MAELEEHEGLIVVREPQQQQQQGVRESVDHPAKLLRIAAMTRQLLEEVRQASLDERGRERLREIYASSLQQLRGTLSEELQEELAALARPLDDVPSESELRVAQAQLVGWLEGLFHGIQAPQFEAMRRRGLPQGIPQLESAKRKEAQAEVKVPDTSNCQPSLSPGPGHGESTTRAPSERTWRSGSAGTGSSVTSHPSGSTGPSLLPGPGHGAVKRSIDLVIARFQAEQRPRTGSCL
jgi:hypothetical protein